MANVTWNEIHEVQDLRELDLSREQECLMALASNTNPQDILLALAGFDFDKFETLAETITKPSHLAELIESTIPPESMERVLAQIIERMA